STNGSKTFPSAIDILAPPSQDLFFLREAQSYQKIAAPWKGCPSEHRPTWDFGTEGKAASSHAFGAARHWRFAGGALTPPLTKGMLTPPWNPSIRFPALTGGA